MLFGVVFPLSRPPPPPGIKSFLTLILLPNAVSLLDELFGSFGVETLGLDPGPKLLAAETELPMICCCSDAAAAAEFCFCC